MIAMRMIIVNDNTIIIIMVNYNAIMIMMINNKKNVNDNSNANCNEVIITIPGYCGHLLNMPIIFYILHN